MNIYFVCTLFLLFKLLLASTSTWDEHLLSENDSLDGHARHGKSLVSEDAMLRTKLAIISLEYQISEAEEELQKKKAEVRLKKILDLVASEDFYYQMEQRVHLQKEERNKLIEKWEKLRKEYNRSLNRSLKEASKNFRLLKKEFRELQGYPLIHEQLPLQ